MEVLVERGERAVYHVAGGRAEPASYLLVDPEAGGILVNAPAFSRERLERLRAVAPLGHIFLPSALGAGETAAWREASGAAVLAHQAEPLDCPVDVRIDRSIRLSRMIDFQPLAGRTRGTCALRLRHHPPALFVGPALEPGADGWPTLAAHDDDFSWEDRVFGALGLKDLRFDYIFCDAYDPQTTRCGPGADRAVRDALETGLGV